MEICNVVWVRALDENTNQIGIIVAANTDKGIYSVILKNWKIVNYRQKQLEFFDTKAGLILAKTLGNS